MSFTSKGFPLFLTFDLDAETMWTARDPAFAKRPILMSQGAYGWKVGTGLSYRFAPNWFAGVWTAGSETVTQSYVSDEKEKTQTNGEVSVAQKMKDLGVKNRMGGHDFVIRFGETEPLLFPGDQAQQLSQDRLGDPVRHMRP